MSSSTHKKVLIRRFEREPVVGFVNPAVYLRATGIELLSPDGAVSLIPYVEVKTVCFVRDFDAADLAREKRLYATRPKTEGLWVRMRFRDNEFMDGVLPNNLLQLEQYGFTLVPPDASVNNQRLFVPREALAELLVLGIVGSPLRKRKKGPVEGQLKMFEEPS